MSKIPRSFVTPTSRLPMLNATPIPVDIPKFTCPSSKKVPSELKKVPLHEIKNIGPGSGVKESIGKGPFKRNAAPASQHPLKKQVKLTPKVSNHSAKIAPYDYKARFNDLADKHKILKSEYTELNEKCEDTTEELESMKSSYESISSQRSTVSSEYDTLTVQHVQLKTEFECLSKNYESAKSVSAELSDKVSNFEKEIIKFKDELTSKTLEIRDTNTKLSQKLKDYDLLKVSFENEVQKCAQLSSTCEENQIKLLSYTSELTFLKTRQKIIDQKNEDNSKTIADLTEENEDLNKKAEKLKEDIRLVQYKLEEKTAESDKFKDAHKLELQNCKNLEEINNSNNDKIICFTNDLYNVNRSQELLQLKNMQDCKRIVDLTQHNIELQKTIESMYENQKKLRNEIQDLKGHIRVFCRIRPCLSGESSKQLLNVDVLDSCTMELDKTVYSGVSGASKKQKHNFTFDGIFPPNSPQSDVFGEVSSLIQSALDGYNVCIFAYGQTGSGKTFTMEGFHGADNVGIIPRAIEMIFTSLPDLRKLGWEFTIQASFLEIYNENIYDLLNPNKDQDEHCIKMLDSKGSDVYVTNLKEETVNNFAELMKLLTTSQKNRQTAATICNERSSRSHSVSKIKILAYHEQRKERYTSNLNLVDLAGSESAKTSQRMDETKSINKSLSELSKVILALQSKQSHIPYRNSKLTYLLMPSLGGNSKTLMLVNIAQFDECYQETVNSLRFAAKVNSCRNGVTKKNISTT